ncbi:g9358 [Coccomyxa viridis]|uniref:G9358 protein n=1 Tax=Coccomyxa viridis TaxID=1274662 RepID=A0ABP1G7J3_9CHLO
MKELVAIMDSKVVAVTAAVLLACYGRYAAPKLSESAERVVSSDWFRFAIIFVIAFIPKRNFYLALAIAIGFLLTFTMLHERKLTERYVNA